MHSKSKDEKNSESGADTGINERLLEGGQREKFEEWRLA